ncbi:MAG TPA: tetratricopeptide repeat protein [Pirellulales bacterium]|nr:tetratricopeptide repeat protein [Pirellulales bacterium]
MITLTALGADAPRPSLAPESASGAPGIAADEIRAPDALSEREHENCRKLAAQLCIRACDLARQHKHELALANFEAAARIYPECPRTDYGRGLCYDGMHRRPEAIQAYKEAVRREPRFIEVRYRLGRILFEVGDLDDAAESFTEAIKIAPRDAQNYSARAAVWQRNRDYQRAIADLDEAIRLDPKTAERYVARAQLKSALGRHDEARQDSDRAVDRAPSKLMIRLYRVLLVLSPQSEGAVSKEGSDAR